MREYRRCRGCGREFIAECPRHRLCWPCWRSQDRSGDQRWSARTYETVEKVVPVLDSRTIRAALALCHPDRHEGRVEQATRVTQSLMAALARVREWEAGR